MPTKVKFSAMFFCLLLTEGTFICPQSSGKATTTYFFLIQYSSNLCTMQFCGSRMFIPDHDRIFSIHGPRSASKNLSILTPNKWFLSFWKYDRGCTSRIRVPYPDPDFLPIPNPGVKKAPDPGSWSTSPASMHNWTYFMLALLSLSHRSEVMSSMASGNLSSCNF
jgi:hypothetical protein